MSPISSLGPGNFEAGKRVVRLNYSLFAEAGGLVYSSLHSEMKSFSGCDQCHIVSDTRTVCMRLV